MLDLPLRTFIGDLLESEPESESPLLKGLCSLLEIRAEKLFFLAIPPESPASDIFCTYLLAKDGVPERPSEARASS